jgi:putative tricarboxylic transport membrane protein
MPRNRYAVLALLLFCVPAAGQGWKPERNVEVIAPSGVGGGTDRTARTLQRILQEQKLIAASTVVNKPGAGGALGLTYLNQRPGDGHAVFISTVPLLTNHITGASTFTYHDVTPLAQLFSEYLLYAVRADGNVRDGGDLVERLKRDPQSVSIGTTSIGGTSHMASGLLLRAIGGEPRRLKIVVFKGGGEVATALLGGHVDLVPAPVGNLLPQVKAGKLRALAVSAPKRLGGDLADVPTWNELGAKAEFDTWRGLVGPRGMTPAQVAYWSDILAKLTATPEWKADLQKNYWENNFIAGEQARARLESEYREFKSILSDIGLAR